MNSDFIQVTIFLIGFCGTIYAGLFYPYFKIFLRIKRALKNNRVKWPDSDFITFGKVTSSPPIQFTNRHVSMAASFLRLYALKNISRTIHYRKIMENNESSTLLVTDKEKPYRIIIANENTDLDKISNMHRIIYYSSNSILQNIFKKIFSGFSKDEMRQTEVDDLIEKLLKQKNLKIHENKLFKRFYKIDHSFLKNGHYYTVLGRLMDDRSTISGTNKEKIIFFRDNIDDVIKNLKIKIFRGAFITTLYAGLLSYFFYTVRWFHFGNHLN